MRFIVLPPGSTSNSSDADGFHLTRDRWDDFGFKTQFYLWHRDSMGNVLNVGYVKIGRRGMPQGYVDVPESFEVLPTAFFSVGQAEDYYSILRRSGMSVEVLESLRDMAYNEAIFRAVWQKELVARESLLRSVSPREVSGPFHRTATGSVKRSPFNFRYRPPGREASSWQDEDETRLDFTMRPRSRPPSNIHVLIGRNGVGKTRLLRSMIASATHANASPYVHGIFETADSTRAPFAGIISVSFSAFDRRLFDDDAVGASTIPYEQVSLRGRDGALMDAQEVAEAFADSAVECTNPALADLWKRALRMLESDPVFLSYGFSTLADWWRDAEEEGVDQDDAEEAFRDDASKLFISLSSGHKVVLFAITRLVQLLEERTLVVMDEPEAHLHPPLLAALIRTVSTLLSLQNGVAIVATHSPVVLQEVPVSCVWELRRVGARFAAARLPIETFAENVDTLTREVFGLEVTKSGYHAILQGAVDEGLSYDEIVDEEFDGQVGSEGRAILRSMITSRSLDEGD